MRIRNRFISAGFKLLYLTLAIYGVLLTLFAPGAELWSLLPYYTLQSNLVCMALMLVLLCCDLTGIRYRHCKLYAALRFCALACILLSSILYHTVVEPPLRAEFPEYFTGFSISSALVNTFLPMMFFLDYLLFDEKGDFRWWHAFLTLLPPACYAAYLLFASGTGEVLQLLEHSMSGFFPVPLLAGSSLIAWCLFFCALGLIFSGYLLIGLDRGLQKLSQYLTAHLRRSSISEVQSKP